MRVKIERRNILRKVLRARCCASARRVRPWHGQERGPQRGRAVLKI
jgi:hypothetical protein